VEPAIGLHHHGGDGVAMQGHQAVQLVGQLGAVGGLAAREGVEGGQVGVGQVVHIGQHGAELPAVGADAADRHAAEADAVIAALPAHEAHPLRLAARLVVGQRHLERGVGALAAGIGEEDVVQPLGRQLRHAGGGLEGDGVAELEGGREIQDGGLLLDRLDDLAAAMAGIAAPQPGRAVQHLAPSGVK
jgi:hypothetical protein